MARPSLPDARFSTAQPRSAAGARTVTMSTLPLGEFLALWVVGVLLIVF